MKKAAQFYGTLAMTVGLYTEKLNRFSNFLLKKITAVAVEKVNKMTLEE